MSELTLDDAIKHCLEVAEQNDTQAEKWQKEGGEQWGKTTVCRECAADHRQLAEWLMELKDLRAEQNDQYTFIRELMDELKEAKWLLKAAVEDNKNVLTENFGDICQFCKHGSNPTAQCCKPHNGSGSWCCENAEWRYADEALALIGEEGENNA